jgi:hypothetical protein
MIEKILPRASSVRGLSLEVCGVCPLKVFGVLDVASCGGWRHQGRR